MTAVNSSTGQAGKSQNSYKRMGREGMEFMVDILFSGFSGKLEQCSLGWGTCALIRDGIHNILLDTGNFGLRFYMDQILAERRLTRSDIDMVLLTHSHFDHSGNIGFYPEAVFVLTGDELEYGRECADRDLYIPGTEWELLKNRKKHLVTKDEEEICPGITTLLTPGHTPGSLSFILHQGGGEQWVLSGDAAKNRLELETLETPMSLNREQSVGSIRKILKAGSRILPGHDGWVTNRDGNIVPEGGAGKCIQTAAGITANGGCLEVAIEMD